jgi:murein DD-endopeptidase MepM/ murein hydrolase activator NlpD
MRRIPNVRASRFLGLGGLLGLGWMSAGTLPLTPDAGVLEPMEARSAEWVQVEILDPGQTFGGVLNRADLGVSEQQAVLLAFMEHASPQRLRVGTEVSFRRLRGQNEVRGVDVVVNPDELVRVERDEFGWRSSRIETPVWTDTIYVAGEITRDLWSAVVLNPALEEMPRGDRARVIDFMDRVFQWQLDFSRQIQTGDRYRLAFERQVRPDGTMRSGRILAAELVNRGSPLHAIWFDLHGDGEGGYYDLQGESLRRAFLRAPLEFRRISSRFNRNRFHPVLQQTRTHIGVDYAAATGTPVRATGDGTIQVRGVQGGYGNLVQIRHANGFMTRYAHLNGFEPSIRVGSRVRQGQVIGYVGSTGMSTGPHLHYELHRAGTPVDPLNIDLPAGDPIPPDHRERWTGDLDVRFALLEVASQGPVFRMAQTGGEAFVDEEDADLEGPGGI